MSADQEMRRREAFEAYAARYRRHRQLYEASFAAVALAVEFAGDPPIRALFMTVARRLWTTAETAR